MNIGGSVWLASDVDLSLVVSEATDGGRGHGFGCGRSAATEGCGRGRPVGHGVNSAHA